MDAGWSRAWKWTLPDWQEVEPKSQQVAVSVATRSRPDQTMILRAMSPAERWQVACSLYVQARAWKAAALRALHPDWSVERIRQTLRKIFLHGFAE